MSEYIVGKGEAGILDNSLRISVSKGGRKLSWEMEKDCGVKGGECLNSGKNDPEKRLWLCKRRDEWGQ